MIYELAYVVKPDATEEALSSVKTLMEGTLKEFGGEILINDTWGVKTFAQPFESGLAKGNFFYVMYKTPGTTNAEIERKMGINEAVVRFMIVKLGDDAKQDSIMKAYKNPNHTQAAEAGEMGESDKDKRMHSKRRSCYFSAKKMGPDWKDPKSYSWLVNEFGKISPARITGLTPKYQRRACDAIKRGRIMGLMSYVSNSVAH
jgi:small subunit ribosomal protein S6